MRVHAYAPGRVNLIGDHTDYAGGLAVPMAIDLGTTVEGEVGGNRVILRSRQFDEPVDLPLDVGDPRAVEPAWGRYVAGIVAEMQPTVGLRATVDSTLPVGSGLSSSAALELSVALALGFEGSGRELAVLCQRAEHRASGVPCGIMDQLTSACGVEDSALLIDFSSLDVTAVPIPEDVEIVVIHSGQDRALASSAYAARRAQVEVAIEQLGRLRDMPVEEIDALDDPIVRNRARHVLTENSRVVGFADAFRVGDLRCAGELMIESHRSLRDDFDVSTPLLDVLVTRLAATPGVFGARLTGAGFGGCAVALCEPGALGDEGWIVRASGAASVDHLGGPDQPRA